MPTALFGINDDTVNLVVNLLVLFLVILWLALIAWTYFDARRRVEDPVLVAFATAASFFPFVGTMVYAILRPPEFVSEKHERELEIRAAELRVRQLEGQSCPNCEQPLERTFLRCPSCRARIKNPCPSCAEPVDPRWSLCPYCETALRRAAPAERRPEGAERRPAAPPRSQRPRPRTPEKRDQPAEPDKRQPAKARKATGSPGDDGVSKRSQPDRERRTKQRQERSPQAPGRRTSSKPRSESR